MADESDLPSLLDSIQILALKAVREEDAEYRLRFIYRWYSETFNTPLHVVEDLPTEDVLRHFFERRFEEIPEDKLLEAVQELLETVDERKSRLLKEAGETDEGDNWFHQVMADVRAGRDPLAKDKALAKAKQDQLPDTFKKATKELGETVKDLGKSLEEQDESINFDFGKAFDPDEDWGLLDSKPGTKK